MATWEICGFNVRLKWHQNTVALTQPILWLFKEYDLKIIWLCFLKIIFIIQLIHYINYIHKTGWVFMRVKNVGVITIIRRSGGE